MTTTIAAPSGHDHNTSGLTAADAHAELTAALKSGDFTALSTPGATLGNLTVVSVDRESYEVVKVAVVVPTGNKTGRSRLEFAYQLRRDATGDGDAEPVLIAAPLPPGHHQTYYERRKRMVKVLSLLLELVRTDPSVTPSKVSKAAMLAAAVRAGIRTPSSETVDLARAVLRALFGQRRA